MADPALPMLVLFVLLERHDNSEVACRRAPVRLVRLSDQT
jgi:hypothetical protein